MNAISERWLTTWQLSFVDRPARLLGTWGRAKPHKVRLPLMWAFSPVCCVLPDNNFAEQASVHPSEASNFFPAPPTEAATFHRRHCVRCFEKPQKASPQHNRQERPTGSNRRQYRRAPGLGGSQQLARGTRSVDRFVRSLAQQQQQQLLSCPNAMGREESRWRRNR
jgi:hypothetical protein